MFSKGGKRRPKALKQLALQELGLAIQDGQHSSVDDARAALYLYLKHAGTDDCVCCIFCVIWGHGVCRQREGMASKHSSVYDTRKALYLIWNTQVGSGRQPSRGEVIVGRGRMRS